ncbi:hypothetical protein [Halobacillus sp. BBL2006]|uniref:hypothetical protein n=1 Tax=Halobacillus sp. BBL2006 TaxID=1543706 RepID=UPI000543E286|nr:hypothetical protein [Halobacillus sp. BBL2006]KHE70933.1 hypothetical protein LD39_10865 [Halobacillus sp. BBL2006]
MDKKVIGIIVAYTLIMASLLAVTFVANWNPSGYDYSIDGQTLTIERGLFSKQKESVDVTDQQMEAVLFYLEVSKERSLWNMDVTVIGLILPFLLLGLIPDRRPFQKFIPKQWYIIIVVAIAALYTAYSVSGHLEHVNEIQKLAEQLLE